MAVLDAEGMGAGFQLSAGGGICVRSIPILNYLVICVTLRVSRVTLPVTQES